MSYKDRVDRYVNTQTWLVKENANSAYSFSGLMAHLSESNIKDHMLNKVYPKGVSDAHIKGYFHIHDLGLGLVGYCAGWSLRQLLNEGYNGVKDKVQSAPPKHFRTALGQMVNFLGTLQMEFAGAQAFSSFDTYLAPYVAKDKLTYKEVRQGIQEFIFNMNVPARWGSQAPFTNITLDWVAPEDLKTVHPKIAGQKLEETYSDFQDEMDMINKAFLEVMLEGDNNGRIFSFPIPTYNITKDFIWDSDNAKLLFEMTAKYGIPYFQNFINSTLKPGDVRSMCCRLQLDLRELKMRGNGLFGAGEQTGSIGVVTLNLPKIAYETKLKLNEEGKIKKKTSYTQEIAEEVFKQKLRQYMDLARESLEIKRQLITENMERNLIPFTKRYLGSWKNHFSTIGIIGMNEACLNLLGKDITTKVGTKFTEDMLDFMRDILSDFQEETKTMYNLEATPAEGTSYRLARLDIEQYPDIITQGEGESVHYTNSTQLPVNHTNDIIKALTHQDNIQTKYTGGTVLHVYLGERITDWINCMLLVQKIANQTKMPYFTITPTFSICPIHGYISGEHEFCPLPHGEEGLKKYGMEVEVKEDER